MLKRELVMTIPQFNAVQRGELTYYEIRKAEKHILKNTRLKKAIVLGMACSLMIDKIAYAGTPNLDGLDVAGNTLLYTAQKIGYWACLIMCLFEIIMALFNGRNEQIKDICIKYLLAFASLFFMPWIFNLIQELFRGL